MSKQNSNLYFFFYTQKTDKCVIRQLSSIFFCIYANLPRFLLDDNMSSTQRRIKITRREKKNRELILFYTILLMLFYTLAVSIYRLIIFIFYFFQSSNKRHRSYFYQILYTISLYGSHILLTFLSLNLVKRTLIELQTHIEQLHQHIYEKNDIVFGWLCQ